MARSINLISSEFSMLDKTRPSTAFGTRVVAKSSGRGKPLMDRGDMMRPSIHARFADR